MGGKRFWTSVLSAAAWSALLCCCAEQNILEGVIGVDAVPPSYVSSRASSRTQLTVQFSEAVSLTSVRFDPELAVAGVVSSENEVRIDFPHPLDAGRRYVVDLVAADADGNTVAVLAPFLGMNDQPPSLAINEIRTEYSKPKVEYVELYARTAGNLGGLGLVTATAGMENPVFVFPPVKVNPGEYIVIHLRSLEEGLIDETGDVGASSGTDSSSTGRDFWVPGTEKRLRSTDVVAVVGTDGEPLEGVAFSEAPETDWKSDSLRDAAGFLESRGAWKGAAASSNGCTATRTLCRDATHTDRDTNEDWRVTATGGATPGSDNAETTYTPKKR